MRWLFLVVLSIGLPVQADLATTRHGKTTEEILIRAADGIPQKLSVLLDDDEIFQRSESRRVSKGLRESDAEIDARRVVELNRLREEVFPGGRLNGVEQVQAFRNLPIVIVRIWDTEGLALLLAHPKVRSVLDATRTLPPNAALVSPHRANTTPQIIAKAQANIPQKLAVVLDTDDIRQRSHARRVAKGLKELDKEINEMRIEEIGSLQEQVFPGGKLYGVEILQSYRQFGIVIVRVENFEDLSRLLEHPHVRAIEDAMQVFPPLAR